MEARQLEARYDWNAAAQLYEHSLTQLDIEHVSPELIKIMELLAKSCFKAAFQSENREEFKRRMSLAQDQYRKLATLYEQQGLTGLASRTIARELFSTFWLEDDVVERKKLLERSTSEADGAAHALEKDVRQLAETHKDMLSYFLEAEWLDTSWASRNERFGNAIEIGERAIEEFEFLGDDHAEDLAQCLSMMSQFLAWLPYQVLEPESFPKWATKARQVGEKLFKASEKAGTAYARCLSGEAVGTLVFLGFVEGDNYSAFKASEDSIYNARLTRDALLIGWACSRAIVHAFWIGLRGEDVAQRQKTLEEGISLGHEGIKNLEIPMSYGLIDFAYDFTADGYVALANSVESDPEKKKHLLRKAMEVATKGMAYSQFPQASHVLSKATQFLAGLENDPTEKRRLLREAMRIRIAAIEAIDKTFAPSGRARGVYRAYSALIKADLAKVETDPATKIELLQGAAADIKLCIDVVSKHATTNFFIDAIAEYEESYGDILLELYSLSKTAESAQLAIKTYEESVAHRKKANLNPAAPGLWKLARTYDESGDLEAASRTFGSAAEEYRRVAAKVPGSTVALEDLASYMETWSAIERARINHNEERYLEAADIYHRAAEILEATRAWRHLSTHYLACAQLERGEAMSRLERPEEAQDHFSTAVRSFDEARLELERKLRHNPSSQEKRELEDWLGTTLGRERYSGARVKLEKARVLDRKGEKEASSTEYYAASEVFKALAKTAQTQQTRQELDSLRLFCEAWSTFKEAEARLSPELYRDAAELFLETEKSAPKEKTRLLAMANVAICKAMASGTLFRRTRDTGLYSEIKKQLETAADYYQEGDFANAAEWTRATGRLFDALLYLADAESEKEPRKKTELFHFAEKHLQLAAKLYGQAGFSKKRDEALRHLEKAREEKELLLTPLDALSENPPTTSPISPVSLLRDRSIGLERFETANVVGSANIHEKEVGVGSRVMVELEMANVGKTPAILVNLENLIPDGFDLDRETSTEKVKDGIIDLKGKRLEYMRTHEIKVPMTATRKGSFLIRPKIIFVDEKGNRGSYELEPATVTVKELGISGWLKGPK